MLAGHCGAAVSGYVEDTTGPLGIKPLPWRITSHATSKSGTRALFSRSSGRAGVCNLVDAAATVSVALDTIGECPPRRAP